MGSRLLGVACRIEAACAAKSSDIILNDLWNKEEKNPGGDFYWQVLVRPDKNNSVLYLDINRQNYEPLAEKAAIIALFAFQECPGCKNVHGWACHAWYFKYHQDVHIVIIRVLCLGCLRTHAIIPSFSIPHTSLDTQTVQCYLEHRDAGLSRQKSAKASGFSGYSLDFLRGLEKRFSTTVFQAKALYPDWGNQHLNGVAWLASASAGRVPALAVLNERRIKQTGQSFFGGNLAEPWRPNNLSKVASHKKATTVNLGSVLDST